MLGLNGVKDIFMLKTKGMILAEDSGTQYNINGPLINNYYMPYVANFNPYEGDRIRIHRSLLNVQSPQLKSSRKLAKKFKRNVIRFDHILLGDTYSKDKNIYYNDAGKLLIDTNGSKIGVISYNAKRDSGGLNGQIVAFVEPIGHETESFS